MVILGISGFEDRTRFRERHFYTESSHDPERLFSFRNGTIPLQFFPLHLIGHDSAAALIVDGEVVAFGSEERFSRVKHGFNLAGQTVLPRRAIDYCLSAGGLSWHDVDHVAHYGSFSESGVRHRHQRVSPGLETHQSDLLNDEYLSAFRNRLSPDVVRGQLEEIAGCPLDGDRFIQVPHHLAHAAGAFYSSDFSESLCLTLDGYGEEESSIWAIGRHNEIDPRGSIELPVSLGLLYQVIAVYLGFRAFGDEYKVMGLSSYGTPSSYRSFFDDTVVLESDGTYRVTGISRPDLFEHLVDRLGPVPLKGGYCRESADIAAALQKKLEETLLHVLGSLKETCPADSLCISGGVGLNACANGVIVRSGLFRDVFFQPAAGDDGASLGAAFYALHDHLHYEHRQPIHHVFWGPGYDREGIETTLASEPGIRWERAGEVEKLAAELLAEDSVIGWFQGRMEMGPRALGGRSILASPRSLELRDRINAAVKGRELFRPFAPSIMAERASEFFDIPAEVSAPFMIVTFQTHEEVRDLIPGVVHVDGSARVHTVSEEHNPRYYRMLLEYHRATGLPLLLNTSFNRAGEPIVNTPEDALKCFLACGLDALIIGDCVVYPRTDGS
ncbi:carbamoyltransferase [Gemmatimonadota bacterium]